MPTIRPLFPRPVSRLIRASEPLWPFLDHFDDILSNLAQPSHTDWIDADETDEAYVFTLALPGFKKDDVTVQVQEGLDGPYVAIAGQRGGYLKVWAQSKPGGTAQKDTRVERAITLPTDADSTKIEAKLEDGLLTVTVAKVTKPTPPAPRKVVVS